MTGLRSKGKNTTNILTRLHSDITSPKGTQFWYYFRLRSYKKRMFFFLLFYVFFDVESEYEVRFCRSPLFFEL